MQILVTNDDGIYAPGLWTLVAELKKEGEITVVAPDREQSGIGSAVTLHHPVRLAPVRPLVAGVEAYSVEGTPADSVIIALSKVMNQGADLVVSGINEGSNLGDDVLISGTVGAALQGYFRGISSIAISVAALESIHFEIAAKLASLLAHKIAAKFFLEKVLLNINVPNLSLSEIRGLEITHLANRTYVDSISEGHDGKRKYYWIVRGSPQWDSRKGSDIWALRNNRISVTPLHSDLTCREESSSLQMLGRLLGEELGAARG